MQHPSSDKRTNQVKRRKMVELRAKGLTHEEIGRRLGVSKQRVGEVLHNIGTTKFTLNCRDCGAEIVFGLSRAVRQAPSLCPACLARTPGHDVGERLKTHRLIAGLTRRALAARTGRTPQALAQIEKGDCKPTPETLARLVAVLGEGLTEVV